MSEEQILKDTEDTINTAYADLHALGALNQIRQAFNMPPLSVDDVEWVNGKYGREMHLANGCPCGHGKPEPIPANSTLGPEPTHLTWWQALRVTFAGLVGEIRSWFRGRT